MSMPAAYPSARIRIAFPLYRGELELRKASNASQTTVALAALIAATQATSPVVGGGAVRT
jgi:hypothetical protein